jgi:hypothetical protein
LLNLKGHLTLFNALLFGFDEWLNTIKILAFRTSSMLLFKGFEKSIAAIQVAMINDVGNIKAGYQDKESVHPITDHIQESQDQDLLIVIAARSRTLSYSHYFNHMPRDLARYYNEKSFIILYPEQQSIEALTTSGSIEGKDLPMFNENSERYSNTGIRARKSPDSRHNSLTE